mmetsp:Transcript_68338/g.193631  ORF Transcript_68338/g.193631 Transcript_68338/m.193631 type:complete len:210 (+) Transcript_68338:1058-1687(+)
MAALDVHPPVASVRAGPIHDNAGAAPALALQRLEHVQAWGQDPAPRIPGTAHAAATILVHGQLIIQVKPAIVVGPGPEGVPSPGDDMQRAGETRHKAVSLGGTLEVSAGVGVVNVVHHVDHVRREGVNVAGDHAGRLVVKELCLDAGRNHRAVAALLLTEVLARGRRLCPIIEQVVARLADAGTAGACAGKERHGSGERQEREAQLRHG